MRLPFVKPIAVLGLLQIIVCFAGILLVATMMKALGYPDDDVMSARMPSWVLFVRHFWMVIVGLPAAWTLWASWDFENEKSQLPPIFHYVAGGLLVFVMGWFFAVTVGTVMSMVYATA